MKENIGIETAADFSKLAQSSLRSEERENFVTKVTGDHRTLQQRNFSLLAECVRAWAEAGENGTYDLRNEATVKQCQEVIKNNPDFGRVPYV